MFDNVSLLKMWFDTAIRLTHTAKAIEVVEEQWALLWNLKIVFVQHNIIDYTSSFFFFLFEREIVNL